MRGNGGYKFRGSGDFPNRNCSKHVSDGPLGVGLRLRRRESVHSEGGGKKGLVATDHPHSAQFATKTSAIHVAEETNTAIRGTCGSEERLREEAGRPPECLLELPAGGSGRAQPVLKTRRDMGAITPSSKEKYMQTIQHWVAGEAGRGSACRGRPVVQSAGRTATACTARATAAREGPCSCRTASRAQGQRSQRSGNGRSIQFLICMQGWTWPGASAPPPPHTQVEVEVVSSLSSTASQSLQSHLKADCVQGCTQSREAHCGSENALAWR